jgi:uncharacterized protein (DUF433 family)
MGLLSNYGLASNIGRCGDISAPLDTCPEPEQPRRVPQAQKRLSRAQIAELLCAYTEGATVLELATEYGIHRTTVMAHLDRNGIPRRACVRSMTDEQVAEAAEARRAGESFAVLGEHYGVSPRTVARELERQRATSSKTANS